MVTMALKPALMLPSTAAVAQIRKSIPKRPASIWDDLYNWAAEFENNIARKLLMTQELAAAYAQLRPAAKRYLLMTAEQWQKFSSDDFEKIREATETAWQEMEPILSNKGRRLLGPEVQTLRGVVRILFMRFDDVLKLWELGLVISDPELEPLTDSVESSIDVNICLAAVLLSLDPSTNLPLVKISPNARTLTRWASDYTLMNIRQTGAAIQEILSHPRNVSIRERYYSAKLQEFIGTGPTGVYEALLKERRQEAARA